jgi:hypothetical protein
MATLASVIFAERQSRIPPLGDFMAKQNKIGFRA